MDPTIKREIEPLWVGEVFSVKIFIESERTLHELQYIIGNMGQIFQNCKNKNPRIKMASRKDSWDAKLNHVIKGTIFSRFNSDFDFNLKILRRAKQLPNENFSPKTGSNYDLSENKIDIGHIFSNSKKTRTRAYIDIDALTMNCLIGGIPGMGKTVLLKSLVSQISEKAPKVGILVINTSKKAEERHFPKFTVIKYGSSRNSSDNSLSNSPEISFPFGDNSSSSSSSSSISFSHFHIPYGILPDNCDVTKVLKKISMNITAVVGLLDFAYRYFYTPLLRYYNKFSRLPESLSLVFSMALRYLDLNPYAANEQQNLRQAISMRGRELIEDSKFLNIVQAKADLPVWLWRFLNDGGKYFLDLTDCDKIVKQFLVISLLQLIDVFTSDRNQLEHVKLRNLIVFDEAHDIFERPIDGDVKSDENVRKQAINQVIQPYLLEYRSRGIGTIISDQQPSILMKSIREQTSLKLLFRLGQECARIYSTSQELQEFIMNQQRYRCVVIDGINGELYQVETHSPKECDRS